jgi:hypothetical protein
MADERKEKVIHTRIPAALEEQIKRLAEGLRVPVSNLVRNMLEDAIDVTRRMRDAVPHMSHSHAPTPAPPPPTPTRDLSSIYGWQALTLNVDTSCARCGALLGAGDDAYLGLSDQPAPAGRTFICPDCLPRRGGGKRRGRNGSSKEQ